MKSIKFSYLIYNIAYFIQADGREKNIYFLNNSK